MSAKKVELKKYYQIGASALLILLFLAGCGGGDNGGNQGFQVTSTDYCVKGGLPRLPGYLTISDTQTAGEYTFRATQGLVEYSGNGTKSGNNYSVEGTDDTGDYGLTITMMESVGTNVFSGTWETWDITSGTRTTTNSYTISGTRETCPGLYDISWDIDVNGIPQFASSNYIELVKIGKISKFRSAVGHDYSDSFESCRSMKHYFEPSVVDWSTVEIYAPFNSEIVWLLEEWVGHKIVLKSTDYPAFHAEVFHVVLDSPASIGDTFAAGELIGTHGSNATMSDIAVSLTTPADERKLVSFFDIMTDSVFQNYQLRGITSRTDTIISKAVRDADPIICSGETFMIPDSPDDWITLN